MADEALLKAFVLPGEDWCRWDRNEPMAMADKSGAGAPSEEAMQALIGKELRTLYDSVLVEPIPDKIVELLIKLDDLTGTPGKRPPSGQSTETK